MVLPLSVSPHTAGCQGRRGLPRHLRPPGAPGVARSNLQGRDSGYAVTAGRAPALGVLSRRRVGLSNGRDRPPARLGRVHLLPHLTHLLRDVRREAADGRHETGHRQAPACGQVGGFDVVIGDACRGCDRRRRHVVPAELTAASEAEGQDEHHDDREAHRDACERGHHDRPAPARDPGAESRPGIRRRLDRPEVVPQAAQGRDRQDGRFDRLGAARTALEVSERVGGGRPDLAAVDELDQQPAMPRAGAAELDHEAFTSTSSFAGAR